MGGLWHITHTFKNAVVRKQAHFIERQRMFLGLISNYMYVCVCILKMIEMTNCLNGGVGVCTKG